MGLPGLVRLLGLLRLLLLLFPLASVLLLLRRKGCRSCWLLRRWLLLFFGLRRPLFALGRTVLRRLPRGLPFLTLLMLVLLIVSSVNS